MGILKSSPVIRKIAQYRKLLEKLHSTDVYDESKDLEVLRRIGRMRNRMEREVDRIRPKPEPFTELEQMFLADEEKRKIA